MEDLKQLMIAKAIERHSKIFPCPHTTRLDECFTLEKDHILFWYNTEDRSTHMVVESIG